MKREFRLDRNFIESEILTLLSFFQVCSLFYFEESETIIELMKAAQFPCEFDFIRKVIDQAHADAASILAENAQ